MKEIVYNVKRTVVYSGNNHRQSDKTLVTNQFDDMSAMFTDSPKDGYITNMSRSDFAGTFPTAPTVADLLANDEVLEVFKPYYAGDYNNSDDEMPVTGQQNGIALINMRGRDF